VAKSLKSWEGDEIIFRKCIFDFDIGRLLKEIFFQKSNNIKTFDFRKCELKKILNEKILKELAEQNVLILK